jgi:hypothetical protein
MKINEEKKMKIKTKLMVLISILLLLIPIINSEKLVCQSKYVLMCDSLLLEKSQEICFMQIGTKEKTNNNDGEVEKYLKLFGLAKGNPYCAAGQYYCFEQACDELKISHSKIPIIKSALAQKIFNDAIKKGKKEKFMPNIHALIVWKKGNTAFGHIERIIKIHNAGWVETIGFNTSTIINRKKTEGVFKQKRNIFHPLGRLKIKGMIGFNTRSKK